MLEIIHVGRIQDPIHKELEVGRIQKLNTHINKSTNHNNIKLQVLKPSTKTRHRIPNLNLILFWVRYISNQRAPYVPQPNYQKQCSWQNMTLERSHLYILITIIYHSLRYNQSASASEYFFHQTSACVVCVLESTRSRLFCSHEFNSLFSCCIM